MSSAIAVTSPSAIAGEPHRRLEAGQLQFGVLRLFVDDALLERLSDDLAHALGGHPLLAGDLVIGPALTQPREDAPRHKTRPCAVSRRASAGALSSTMPASLGRPPGGPF
jgi:hypothetical protein